MSEGETVLDGYDRTEADEVPEVEKHQRPHFTADVALHEVHEGCVEECR
jgi:hypothetical protein